MGGKSGMTGILDFYANGHLEALNSPNKGIICSPRPEDICPVRFTFQCLSLLQRLGYPRSTNLGVLVPLFLGRMSQCCSTNEGYQTDSLFQFEDDLV